jgi:hypothetical protein
MSAILIMAIPVFILSVDVRQQEKAPYQGVA